MKSASIGAGTPETLAVPRRGAISGRANLPSMGLAVAEHAQVPLARGLHGAGGSLVTLARGGAGQRLAQTRSACLAHGIREREEVVMGGLWLDVLPSEPDHLPAPRRREPLGVVGAQ